MELPLRIQLDGSVGATGDSARLDVLVQCPPGATVADLATAIAAVVGHNGPCTIEHLRPGDPLTTGGPRPGSTVRLVPPGPDEPRRPVARLIPTDGPGHPLELEAGFHRLRLHPSGGLVPLGRTEEGSGDVVLMVGTGVEVADPGGTVGLAVDGAPVRGAAGLHPGRTLAAGPARYRLELTGAGAEPGGPYRVVGRAPRRAPDFEQVVVEVPDAPGRFRPPRFPWLTAMAGSSMGFVFYAANPNWATMAMAGAMSGMMVASGVEQRMDAKRQHLLAVSDWESACAEIRSEADSLGTARRRELLAAHPDSSELLHRLAGGTGVWVRGPEHPDAVTVSVGTGARDSLIRLDHRRAGTPERRAAVAAMATDAGTLDDTPLTIDLRAAGHLGVIGDRDRRDAAARSIVARLALRTAPSALRLVVVAAPDRAAAWEWLKWLPHLDVVTDPEHPAALDTLLAGSPTNAESAGCGRRTVVVVDGLSLERRVSWRRLIDEGPARGVHAIWVAPDEAELPSACGSHLKVGDPATLVETRHGRSTPVIVDALGPDEADAMARALAALREADAPGDASLPDAVGLLSMIGAGGDATGAVASVLQDRWARHRAGGGLRFPLGATAAGVLSLDLRTDGPHALVAGTTGAGKSELLQSLVAGLAATVPPERVTFLLVDYKGGAAFAGCAGLPHTVGMVTDLDDGLVHRTLTALRAEVRRREELLAAAGVRDLVEFEERDPEAAPPALVVVVDEFAALRTEVPDFLDGVVDLAQRGRSLGIHLVLATQRPAGVVTDQIRANTNLRIALRTADRDDSADVVADPAAADIPRSSPGRALVRIGPTELIPVQAAYAGRAADGTAQRPRIHRFRLTGCEPLEASPPTHRGGTELEALVRAAHTAVEATGRTAPRRPWLDPLPEHLPFEASPCGGLTIGRTDRPEAHRQDPAVVDLDRDGSLLVVGGPGAGSSTALTTLAGAAAHCAAPTRVWALDGTGALTGLLRHAHVGDVVGLEDTERVVRLLEGFVAEIRHRLARPEAPRDRRLLLVDTWESFESTHERTMGGHPIRLLELIIREGRAAGVHTAIAATRPHALPAPLMAAIGSRLVLRQGSADDLAAAEVPPGLLEGEVPPGRGVLDGVLIQVAEPPPAAPATEAAPAAEPVPRLADRIHHAELSSPEAIGVHTLHLGAVTADPAEGTLLVTGGPGAGRSTALAAVSAAWCARPGRQAVLLRHEDRPPHPALAHLRSVDLEDLGATEDRDLLVVIDDAESLLETHDDALTPLFKASRNRGPSFAVALESGWVQRAWGDAAGALKAARRALLLRPDTDAHGAFAGVELPRWSHVQLGTGRGYLALDGAVTPIQVAVTTG